MRRLHDLLPGRRPGSVKPALFIDSAASRSAIVRVPYERRRELGYAESRPQADAFRRILNARGPASIRSISSRRRRRPAERVSLAVISPRRLVAMLGLARTARGQGPRAPPAAGTRRDLAPGPASASSSPESAKCAPSRPAASIWRPSFRWQVACRQPGCPEPVAREPGHRVRVDRDLTASAVPGQLNWTADPSHRGPEHDRAQAKPDPGVGRPRSATRPS